MPTFTLSAIAKTLSLASLANHESRGSSLPQPPRVDQNVVVPQKTKSPVPSSAVPRRKRPNPSKPKKPKQPSVAQIERAIGAGTFRDSGPCDLEESEMELDGVLPVTGGTFEGEVEKKLREAGEFISSKTEAAFRSAEKRILLVAVLLILPAWTFFLLVAAGVIELPLSIPLIDDLIM